jgi:hypothetical protein
MNSPELDIEARTPVWDSMQNLFLDDDATLAYEYIARECTESDYSVHELECILFNEVMPALRFNLSFYSTIPEWAGFDKDWLVERILKTHRYGKRRPWRLRKETHEHWMALKPLIERARSDRD